ncbi:MAG: hypothetical protein KatS3mg100_538 [Candidatus Parcubacteria bacterium]|nr:MAG: hypothetical protein KatS3mg100_538 [Candidatus Parcubacteria bacterium]
MKQNHGNAIIWFLILGAIAASFIFSGNDNNSNYNSSNNSIFRSGNSYEEERTIDRYDAIYQYWDEIKDYVSGTETLDACSYESGNCYSLDAEISNGQIEMVYFPNGGYLYFSADIDESGNASDIDQNGNSWDFTIDMDSSMIDNAIYDWASDNGYTVE